MLITLLIIIVLELLVLCVVEVSAYRKSVALDRREALESWGPTGKPNRSF